MSNIFSMFTNSYLFINEIIPPYLFNLLFLTVLTTQITKQMPVTRTTISTPISIKIVMPEIVIWKLSTIFPNSGYLVLTKVSLFPAKGKQYACCSPYWTSSWYFLLTSGDQLMTCSTAWLYFKPAKLWGEITVASFSPWYCGIMYKLKSKDNLNRKLTPT